MADTRFGGSRRDFLKQSLAVAGGAALPVDLGGQAPAASPPGPAAAAPAQPAKSTRPTARPATIAYPRVFTGPQLAMLAFPLGGLGAGSISLGGSGQLRDWEIFNRSNKGYAPGNTFAAIWVKRGAAAPVTRVLEARLQPPYEGPHGLGGRSAPGLQRLDTATFTGEFPFARIDFQDRRLPVRVSLEAFTPFIPHDADDSGLPAAILRYRVVNPTSEPIDVSIAWSVENPVRSDLPERRKGDTRANEPRRDASIAGGLEGLLMHDPSLDREDAMSGSVGLWALGASTGPGTDAGAGVNAGAGADRAALSMLRGWPRARWWTSVLRYWDDFTADGRLGPEAKDLGPVGALCQQHRLPPKGDGTFTFLLTWHFPNRTPERCGWEAPKGQEKTVIGNHYATRFADAWEVARHTATHLDRLERRTRQFAEAVRESTLPGAIKDAAMANLSTLVTQTTFRTADGEFHGFEGLNDKGGCCMGNCTHVWNYETSTAHLFPAMSRSLRRAAFGYSLDEQGAIRVRQMLPDERERFAFTAADGQMGQIIKVYMDWRLSGDDGFLRAFWPKVKRALAFTWLPGGWDADRDGVMEGVQHNTYDVEFYGPNPQCGIYYLGALRASEEMARHAGESDLAAECRRLFESGRAWIDAQLFNGEYYVQQVRGVKRDQVLKTLVSSMGSDEGERPEYQVGDGCLVDQLVGQCLAEVAGLGPLVDPAHCRTALASIHRYNYRRDLFDHACLQRTYALNDEAALVVCDYGRGTRPAVPFPYYAEVWTGLEYTVGAHMLYAGMLREGIDTIANVRVRYDGVRRNPWNEAECGHHYARAMAAWSGLLALSGFRYDGVTRHVALLPRLPNATVRSFWSTGTGWGTFTTEDGGRAVRLTVIHGTLPCRSIDCEGGSSQAAPASKTSVQHAAAASTATATPARGGRALPHEVNRQEGRARVTLADEIVLAEGETLELRL